MGKLSLSLSQKFAAILAMFVAITAVVLFLLISAKNEPIDFATQELKGTAYQTPVEHSLRLISLHRVVAQRALYGEKKSQDQLVELQDQIDKSLQAVAAIDKQLGEDLQFTEQGLKSRKRDHFNITNVTKEWKDLKDNLKSKKPAESNELHAHLVTDLRTMITHLGDTSNLILDPDLDSYYLMDITLLALPQAQDRIQNITVEMEPIVRRKTITLEERMKASAWVAMMSEADLERIKGDYQTVLNEDPNFYGKSETLEKNLAPVHQAFVDAYGAFIAVAKKVSEGQEVTLEEFLKTSNDALEASYAYWHSAEKEMDALLTIRHDTIYNSKIQAAVWSVLGMLFSLVVAWFFIRYLTANMRNIVSLLAKASESVAVASGHSSTLATSLSDSSNQQAAGLQQTVASLEEISSKVSQNAESAVKAKSAADDNQRVSEEGASSVDEMMSAIGNIRVTNDEISHQMEASNREFAEIVKIISEIGAKTTVINDIVFQTRLLSFNASVEAARAGEHGKGFAVVAEEVGNLAQMSGDAAKEISDMLADSITKVNAIVENTRRRVDALVETAKGKIEAGEVTANACREALTKMSTVAQSIASMVNEIAVASQEQSQGISEINKAIAQLDDATQQNSSVASESSSEAEKLNQEADKLTSTVRNLRKFVDGTATAA